MRTHTIGEVLNQLKGEFDDITISKIRFLEAEGLINPDRTESGYRKFTDADIERLRYVLRAQRDRYLPLKVIKDELARIDAGLPPTEPADPTPDPAEVAAVRDGSGDATGTGTGAPQPAAGVGSLEPPSDVALTLSELAQATGLTERQVRDLRDHGLLPDRPTYDGHDLVVGRLAADLLGAGLEVRHLRMYRQFADREAAMAEQLTAPLLRQRNPDSRRQATAQAEHLAEIGGRLHKALLSAQLRALLRP
ncbi:MerR family DNA-binding transcriptional regulator [Nitriliruptoraceae bacterium ZYF776]|nr:MerR family DNA-binding transcriptional regulator [Profundirhabdus halotolerans]